MGVLMCSCCCQWSASRYLLFCRLHIRCRPLTCLPWLLLEGMLILGVIVRTCPIRHVLIRTSLIWRPVNVIIMSVVNVLVYIESVGSSHTMLPHS